MAVQESGSPSRSAGPGKNYLEGLPGTSPTP